MEKKKIKREAKSWNSLGAKLKQPLSVYFKVTVRIQFDNEYDSALKIGPISTKYSCLSYDNIQLCDLGK